MNFYILLVFVSAVILLASFHEPSVVFEQLSLIYSLPRYLVRSFRLILPFFPTGTMERIDTEGQVRRLVVQGGSRSQTHLVGGAERESFSDTPCGWGWRESFSGTPCGWGREGVILRHTLWVGQGGSHSQTHLVGGAGRESFSDTPCGWGREESFSDTPCERSHSRQGLSACSCEVLSSFFLMLYFAMPM